MRIILLPEKSGIRFLDENGVLEVLHHSIDQGNDHFNFHIFAELATLEAKAYEGNPAVGILGDQKAVDLALQPQLRAVFA